MPLPVPRPPDLIPIDAAARRVDRSRSTLRGWIRDGQLQAWHQDPARPANTRLLVSTAALQRLVVITGKAARPGRPARPANEDAEVDALRASVAALRQALTSELERQAEVREGHVHDLEQALGAAQRRTSAWETRALRAEAERNALGPRGSRPWWQRLLGPPNSGG